MTGNGPTRNEWNNARTDARHEMIDANARFDRLETRINQLFAILAGLTVLSQGVGIAISAVTR